MILRRGLIEDVDAIVALERETPEAPHWGIEAWSAALRRLDEGREIEREVFVADSDGRVVGLVVVSRVGDIAELESVAVGEAARRRGVGRALCNAAVAWSLKHGARVIELEVRASSEGALPLYHDLGFRETGRRAKYYLKPADDAILMSLTLVA